MNEAQIPKRWLPLLRAGWVVLSLIVLGIFVAVLFNGFIQPRSSTVAQEVPSAPLTVSAGAVSLAADTDASFTGDLADSSFHGVIEKSAEDVAGKILAGPQDQGPDNPDDTVPPTIEDPPASHGRNAENCYVVQRGDSLSYIAQRCYGKASKWPLIFEGNRDVLHNPHELPQGCTLAIPPEK